jgi:GLPGLI family protein
MTFMRIRFIILFFFIVVVANAQTTLKIEYNHSTMLNHFNYNTNQNQSFISQGESVRMLLNDSMAHIHNFREGLDPYKKNKKIFGKKLIHHGEFLDFKNLNYYSESNEAGFPSCLIARDCSNILKWKIAPENTKVILGNKCIAAYGLTEKSDTTLVYFTSDLKFKKGFLFYEGIPGVVLESFVQLNGSVIHFEAVKIEEVALQLVAPECKRIISCEEYGQILKKRNTRLGF